MFTTTLREVIKFCEERPGAVQYDYQILRDSAGVFFTNDMYDKPIISVSRRAGTQQQFIGGSLERFDGIVRDQHRMRVTTGLEDVRKVNLLHPYALRTNGFISDFCRKKFGSLSLSERPRTVIDYRGVDGMFRKEAPGVRYVIQLEKPYRKESVINKIGQDSPIYRYGAIGVRDDNESKVINFLKLTKLPVRCIKIFIPVEEYIDPKIAIDTLFRTFPDLPDHPVTVG